jgi:hypothetical protein
MFMTIHKTKKRLTIKIIIMKKALIHMTVVGMLSIAIVTGCQKNVTVIIKPQTVIITTPVSFSKDMVPIFTANCAVSGCHVSGGQIPNLTASSAYSSLTGGDFVNVSSPASSKLYEQLTGVLNPKMPIGKPNNPSNINALVLAWIQQGAKNN